MQNIQALKGTYQKRKLLDQFIKWFSLLVFAFICACFIAIILFLIIKGAHGLKDIFTTTKWDFVKNYGILPILVGSLFVTLFALAIAIPVSLSTAIIINEYLNSKAKTILNGCIEVLAGIPSVIYGFFGTMFFVANHLLPYSVALAAIVLSFMILPNITHFINIGIQSLPKHYRESSYALGANKTETIFKVILPNIKTSIFNGSMMGLARAIGETIAVTMLIGTSSHLNAHSFFTDFFNSFLFAPNQTMSSAIANNFLEATKHQVEILYAVALVLFTVVASINVLILYLQHASQKKRQGKNYANKK